MVEAVDSSPRQEKAPKRPPLKPQKIENFDNILAIESAHGNAGKDSAGIMGKIDKGSSTGVKVVATHGPEGIDFTYRAHVDIHQMVELSKTGALIPPVLIKDAEMRGSSEDYEVAAKAARNHNAAEIIDYLKRGGDASYLTTGDLIPTPKEIQDFMRRQNKAGIISRFKSMLSRRA